MSEEYDVQALLDRIEELELNAIPADERIANMQAAYERKIQALLAEARNARGIRKDIPWREADFLATGKREDAPKVEVIVWPEWRVARGQLPYERALYAELHMGRWYWLDEDASALLRDGEGLDEVLAGNHWLFSVSAGDRWVPWSEVWA